MGIRLARAGGVEDGRYCADAGRCRETVVNSDLARNFDSYSLWATHDGSGRHLPVLGSSGHFG